MFISGIKKALFVTDTGYKVPRSIYVKHMGKNILSSGKSFIETWFLY